MKKVLSIIMSIAMLVGIVSSVSISTYAETYMEYCGNDAIAVIDTNLKTLTISGTGAVNREKLLEYGSVLPIVSVVIRDGIILPEGNPFLTYSMLNSISVSEENTIYSTKDGVLFNKDMTELISYPQGNTGSYSIAEGVNKIGDCAFYNSSLNNITIPESVISVGNEAFLSCNLLTSIEIPKSVTSIGEMSLCGIGLTKINVDGDNPNYISEYGVLFSKDMTMIIQYPMGNKRTSYVIPDGVKSIGDYSFNSCDSLKSVTIPNSVTSIGSSAFNYCSNLKSITIGNSVTIIGNSAFEDCRSLTSVTIPNSVTSIGDSAFYSCNSLSSITIPSSVTSVGDGAFSCCDTLTNIDVDSENKFYTAVDGVLFDKNVTSILQYPNGKTDTSYVITEGITSIGNSAFKYCNRLTSVTIPNSVTSIGNKAFDSCSSLTSVTIPNSVINIGDYAFAYSGLEDVVLPKSVEEIGDSAFYCENLKSITILNKNCTIFDSQYTLYSYTTGEPVIYSSYNSKAKEYAKKYLKTFVYIVLECDYEKEFGTHDLVITKNTFEDCYGGGKIEYICRDCGYTYTKEIPAGEHNYVDGFCSVCSAIEINMDTAPIFKSGTTKKVLCNETVGMTRVYKVSPAVSGEYTFSTVDADVMMAMISESDFSDEIEPVSATDNSYTFYMEGGKDYLVVFSFEGGGEYNVKLKGDSDPEYTAESLGGSIRANDAGLRFGFSYDETQGVTPEEYGFIYSYSETTDLTVEGVGTNGVKKKVASNKINHGDYTTFNLVFTNLPKSAFNTVVSARAYVKIDGEYYYSDVLQRSFNQVANAVLADDEIDEATKNAIQNILNQ